jgi:hypothetical protein
MPVHKFITKQCRNVGLHDLQPDSVRWIPKEVVHQPIRQNNGLRWEIFAQQLISIPPGGKFTAVLGLGVHMTDGICLVSLKQELKQKRCSLQDGIVAQAEVIDDIIVTILNNSEHEVIINEGDSLFYVNYNSRAI